MYSYIVTLDDGCVDSMCAIVDATKGKRELAITRATQLLFGSFSNNVVKAVCDDPIVSIAFSFTSDETDILFRKYCDERNFTYSEIRCRVKSTTTTTETTN